MTFCLAQQLEFFYIFFFFSKINSPSKNLQNYTSTAVGHGGSLPLCPARECTVATATAVAHGGKGAVYFKNFVTFLFELGWR
jgi:hypothetical protein